MNSDLKEHINQTLKKGLRLDGRKLDEFRDIKIETGTLTTAEGSAVLRCGDVHIIAGVKMDLGTPYADKPNAGTLMVNAELRPISNPDFEAGPPSVESIEVSRVIDRGIRESKAIDEEGLCVTAGEKVWSVSVDICPLNHDGNLIDLGGLAAIAALRTTKIPDLKDGMPDFKKKGKKSLELAGIPIPVTIVKIGDNMLVDPTDAEMHAADARLTVTTLEDGTICALQKGGDCALTIEDLDKMLTLAVKMSAKLRKILG